MIGGNTRHDSHHQFSHTHIKGRVRRETFWDFLNCGFVFRCYLYRWRLCYLHHLKRWNPENDNIPGNKRGIRRRKTKVIMLGSMYVDSRVFHIYEISMHVMSDWYMRKQWSDTTDLILRDTPRDESYNDTLQLIYLNIWLVNSCKSARPLMHTEYY
jgi:hypothetical protein